MNFFSKNQARISFFLIFLGIFSTFSVYAPLEVRAQNDVKPTFFFLRNLKQGDTGQDVLELQKLLNADLETHIPGPGIGSLGKESTFFGPKTKAAVTLFQAKYANEVLRPAGLTHPTGIIDLWTRMKLNQILLKATVGQIPVNTEIEPPVQEDEEDESEDLSENDENVELVLPVIPNVFNDSSTKTAEPVLTGATAYAAPPGGEVTLTGNNFSKTSQVSLSKKYKVTDFISVTSTQIRFQIPSSAEIGRYDLAVLNGAKTSNTLPFMVIKRAAAPPVVKKAEPAIARFGQEITITGENFAKTGNIVSSNVGVVRGLASVDGKTLKVVFPLPEYLEDYTPGNGAFGGKDNINWPVNLFVVNENGMSERTNAAQFIINL